MLLMATGMKAQWTPNMIMTGHRPAIRKPATGGQNSRAAVMTVARTLPMVLVTGPMTMKPNGTRTRTVMRGTSIPLSILGMYLYRTFSSCAWTKQMATMGSTELV